MSDLKLPGDDEKKKREGVTNTRLLLWLVVTGVALYLLISGIAGIIAKAAH